MLSKSIFLIALFFLSYYLSVWGGLKFLCPLLGVFSASLGLCVQHDANHGALSSIPWVNRLFGFMDDVIGGSGLMWRHQVNSFLFFAYAISLFFSLELPSLSHPPSFSLSSLPFQHCVGHHIFCNDVENDNDTKSQFPLMKMNPSLPHRAYLQFQHLYFPFLYSLLGISYPLGDAANYMNGSYAGL